jgi:hypothetical protein
MKTRDRLGYNWTLVLRRRPARMVKGRAQGGYTEMFEIICCDCGDDPDLDYREVSAALQRIRGPYTIAVGVAAYETHASWHESQHAIHQPGHPGCG